ncbi:MAG: 4-hydroxy-3-methylbut-2-enyl diphosphate reductase [Betaproteobacteria bacterium]|jgi:4-hydroxy-3-methylbut-2-enyl diphosphate reductase|nr:4-hydroxy-3-methylbut-2-enyl diphosphate reductase [Betaproteobacteria bacterium]
MPVKAYVPEKIFLAQPRGFCAGVTRAIDIVDRALEKFGAPVYVFHEIVHNQFVVNELRGKGAIFVNSLDDIPENSLTIFSAHGVSQEVRNIADSKLLRVIDATCPLVTKVHMQAQRYAKKGFALVMIGHPGHEEVEGTIGSVDIPVYLVSQVSDVATLSLGAKDPVAYVTQTTLSMDDTRDIIDALTQRYPHIEGPHVDDICYATQNRQTAVRALAEQVDMVLVVGARNSSNSNRLREVAASQNIPAYLVQDETELQPSWLLGVSKIGITSGASTPEILVKRVVDALAKNTSQQVIALPGVQEDVVFRLPLELA